MKIHRFIGEFEAQGDYLEIKEKELFNQIKNVLELKPGERVILADGKGKERLAEIKSIHPQFIGLQILEEKENINDPKIKVSLYCAVLKADNFELVVQKATEVGVSRIIPLVTERTVKLGFRKERLEKIIKEAAEQSGRSVLPKIDEPLDFEAAVQKAVEDNEINLLFDISGGECEKPNWLKMYGDGTIGIFIGPEGGFSESELDLAKSNNYQIVSLGKLTLRAETAAIIASYLVVH